MKDFEILPHTADIKIRVFGKSLEDLFRNAVIGMFQTIGPQAPECERKNNRLTCPSLPIQREIEINSFSLDSLLVDFLSEALYLSDVHNEAYLDAKIHGFDETNIKATLLGIAIEGFEIVEIKAVTYHELEIKKVNDLWQTNIVFDI